MTLDEFVSKGFADHAADAEAVFARLPQGVTLVREAKHLPTIAHLITHVSGEHLGRWNEGVALLDSLQRLPVFDAATPEGKAVLRSKAILHRCAGDLAESARCTKSALSGGDIPDASDRIRILAIASSALVGRSRLAEARRDFEEAVALASYGPTKSDPAARALGVTAHNIACELESRPSLSDDERALMLRCAFVSRDFWKIAGGPSEAGQAEYRLAMSHIKAGDGRAALAHAAEYLRISADNGNDPGDAFFAREAMSRAKLACRDAEGARSERDAMNKLLPTIADADFRSFAAEELAKLDAALAAV